ncbi:HAD family phosphatase [candidate division KSB1 bacterium]|nr:HAD family phosphatase [candidate division KSB1 bacterium]
MYKLILFDLGGVLVEFTGIDPLIALSRNTLTKDTARRFWLESPWVNKLETGRCSTEEFAAGIITELKLSLTIDEFIREFVSWEKGPYPGALELLDSLNSYFKLACLTNNNEIHWRTLNDICQIQKKFFRCYVSYIMGMMKPDKIVFEYVLNDMKLKGEQVLFFDDNPENVNAARSLNIDAYCVKGVSDVIKVLKEKNILT